MSIRVRVLLHANLREIVGKREVIEEISSNSTLRDILDKLAQRYGRDFKQIVDPGTGAISLEFLVSINGRIIRDANVKLNNDDVLILSIPIGGG
ncbi:MAG: MoaD/ThiS family protein [Candidatus Bathyarchaeota archaeon]|nr:MAG: MoaD/ThiS family protein [Candidatus Bathyarchaeota archaeon]